MSTAPPAVARRRWPRRLSSLAYFATLAAVVSLLLAAVVPFGPFPLRVPFHYRGDAVLLTALIKGAAEDGPLQLTRIGAPFGSDLVDWPAGMWLLYLVSGPLVRATGEAGLAINLLWLGSTVLTALSAAWALGRLGHGRLVAFGFGLAYAFLPCGFYANVDHVNLVFPLVPPLALLALRLCAGGSDEVRKDESWVSMGACVAQGLTFVYYSFFAAWLLLVGTALGWARTRRRDLLRRGAQGVALLVLAAAVPLLPSLAYWSRHGRNEKLQYKVVAEADRYGLKLRQMLLPIEDHPLPPLRWAAARVRQAAFPGEDEDATARLGTLGAIGLVALLGFLVGRAAGVATPDRALGPPAALTLAALLLAQVGGLGSLFNVLVVPDIRGYDRIVVFVAFFALHAAAVLLERAAARLPWSWPAWVGPAATVLLAAAVVADQVPREELGRLRWSTAPAFAEDAAFVARLESLLPPGAMVFQLPHATIPLEVASRPPLSIYDPGRAFLHSRTLRWSWGSVLGRHGDWQAQTSRLTPSEMARQLALAGFEGVWVDRLAFPEAGPRPWPTLESALSAAAGAEPIVSSGGRYSFVRLTGLRQRLAAAGESGRPVAAQAEALAQSVVLPIWREGCSDEQGELLLPSRICGATARAVLHNDSATERRLVLTGRLRALRPGRLRVSLDGAADELELAGAEVPYRRELTIPAGRRVRLELVFSGPCEATSPRPRCLEVIDMKATAPGANPP